MKGRKRAELKNKILEFFINDPVHLFPTETLWNNLGKPVSKLQFQEVLDEMVSVGGRYFLQTVNSPFKSYGYNDLTQDYLDIGGFVNQYESDLEADEQLFKLESQNQRINDLTEENLKLVNRLSKQKLKTHVIPIVISGISALVAIGSLLYMIFKPETSTNIKELKQMEQRLNYIEGTLSNEVDSLKNKLYEAETLIEVYESDTLKVG
ncbi:hypothetical protein [Maribacter litoralis]|uniref:hypothetical protein n=1 Tax=Maribacter litoralis TaxID=2059726 RepID=UPI003D286469